MNYWLSTCCDLKKYCRRLHLKIDKVKLVFNLDDYFFSNLMELETGIELLTLLTLEGVAERRHRDNELKRRLVRGLSLHYRAFR